MAKSVGGSLVTACVCRSWSMPTWAWTAAAWSPGSRPSPWPSRSPLEGCGGGGHGVHFQRLGFAQNNPEMVWEPGSCKRSPGDGLGGSRYGNSVDSAGVLHLRLSRPPRPGQSESRAGLRLALATQGQLASPDVCTDLPCSDQEFRGVGSLVFGCVLAGQLWRGGRQSLCHALQPRDPRPRSFKHILHMYP